MLNLVRLLLLLAVNIISSNAAIRPRIVGGYNTNVENHPYIVSLSIEGLEFFCGGSLITPTCVITAAHCLSEITPKDLQICGGSTRLADNNGTFCEGKRSRIRNIQYWIVPKSYNDSQYSNHDMDVAILKLDRPLNAAIVKPVTIDYSPLKEGDTINVAGWGGTIPGDLYSHSFDHLKAVNLTVASQTECKSTYATPTTENMLCVQGDGGKRFYLGDSGGPAIHNGKLVAIISKYLKFRVNPLILTRLSSKEVSRFVRVSTKEFC